MNRIAHYGFILMFLCRLVSAADQDDTESIVIPTTTVINKDLFLSGDVIEVSGTINGDLYVLGKQVFIDGTVNGDLLIIGASVTINGVVTHSIRALGAQVEVNGVVRRNLSVLAANLELGPKADIGLNATVFAGNASIASTIRNDVRLHASTARFSGVIGNNMRASIGRMRITSKARVQGDLTYWSDQPALISKEAFIQGNITHHPSPFSRLFQKRWVKGLKIGSKLAGLLMNFLYSLIIGLIVLRYFPKRIDRAIYVLSHRPIKALIAGIVVLVLLPLSCLLLLMTILGTPFALALLSVTILGFYTAKLLPLFWLKRRFASKGKWASHPHWFFAFLLLTYFALTLIPYFGMALSTAALLFGLGSLVLGKQIDFSLPPR